jgi:hypothetical protein
LSPGLTSAALLIKTDFDIKSLIGHHVIIKLAISVLVAAVFSGCAQGTDQCSMLALVRDSNFSVVLAHQVHLHHQLAANHVLEEGVVVSLYSGLDTQKVIERWRCQQKNHESYCESHKYKCLFVTDTVEWAKERNETIATESYTRNHKGGIMRFQYNDFWMKIQVLRDLLTKHQWVLYLDTDTIFNAPNITESVETIFANFPDEVSMFLSDHQGWGSDLVLLRSTPFSNAFLEHVWNLRSSCPHCMGEQGAIHVALLDVLAHHALEVAPQMDLVKSVARDNGKSCCNPRGHCEYPQAGSPRNTSNALNDKANMSVQGCVWNWQVSKFPRIRTSTVSAVIENNCD